MGDLAAVPPHGILGQGEAQADEQTKDDGHGELPGRRHPAAGLLGPVKVLGRAVFDSFLDQRSFLLVGSAQESSLQMTITLMARGDRDGSHCVFKGPESHGRDARQKQIDDRDGLCMQMPEEGPAEPRWMKRSVTGQAWLEVARWRDGGGRRAVLEADGRPNGDEQGAGRDERWGSDG